MREVQDGIEESKQGSGRARRKGGVNQGHRGQGMRGPDYRPRVLVNRLDLGTGW